MEKRANRLIHEQSPYLLQHAHNPVDWFPWSSEAFEKAKREDKPIFLSIGYSSCHWCHVMAHESFENEEIAALMNRYYVNIKVDREERPDIDHIYQQAAQLAGVPGGWPLSVFLTPDQKPFWVGTYLPPDNRFGRMSFPFLLEKIAEIYRSRRHEIEKSAVRIVSALQEVNRALTKSELPEEDLLQRSAERLLADYDPEHGGFGGSPKFPQTPSLELLLHAAKDDRQGKNSRFAQAVWHTLTQMARGGIYDQLGGGFHRYSVDEAWRVPHFEKMLYDNALLADLYIQAYQFWHEPSFAQIARETLEYVLREMTDEAGAFHSAQDADSEGEEGKFFVWSPEEIHGVLGTDAPIAWSYYGVTNEGNFEGGKTVLSVQKTPEELVEEFGLQPEEVRNKLDSIREKLFQTRERRVRPGKDDKIIASWNGLMISAFARAGFVFQERRFTQAASDAAQFILRHMRDDDGRLRRSYRNGASAVPGFLEDYAALIGGLIELHQAEQEYRWLQEAIQLAEVMVDQFWDDEHAGWLLTPRAGETLIGRPRDWFDASIPSGSALATRQLWRLASISGRNDWLKKVEEVLQIVGQAMKRSPHGLASHLLVWNLYRRGPLEAVYVLPEVNEQTQQTVQNWMKHLSRHYLPNLILAVTEASGTERSDLAIASGKAAVDGRVTGYICRDFRCSAPLTQWQEIETHLV